MDYENVISELLDNFILNEENEKEKISLEECKTKNWNNFVLDDDLINRIQDKNIVLIQTIGKSKAPILFSLSFFKPTNVFHICTEDTKKVSELIKEKLEKSKLATVEILTLENRGNKLHENIKIGYKALNKAFQLNSFMVLDLTGGKKTMSSTLANLYVQLYQDENFKKNSLLVYIEYDEQEKKSKLWNISNAIQINAYYSYLLRKKSIFSKSYDFAYEVEMLNDVKKNLNKFKLGNYGEISEIEKELKLLNIYSSIHNNFSFPNYKSNDQKYVNYLVEILENEKTEIYNKLHKALEVMNEWTNKKNKNINTLDDKNEGYHNEYKIIEEGLPFLIIHFYLMSKRLSKQKKKVEASLYAYRGIEALSQFLLIKEFKSLDFYKGKSEGFKFDKVYIEKFFDYYKLNALYKKLEKREERKNKDYDEIENIRSGLTSYVRTYFAILLYKTDNNNVEALAEKLSNLFSKLDSAIDARNSSILIHGYGKIESSEKLIQIFEELLKLCEKEIVSDNMNLQKMIELMLYPFENLEDFWHDQEDGQAKNGEKTNKNNSHRLPKH